ncbi:MAG: sigma-70 family RNA polymerase sigma factor [Acidobacteriota bacterium]
MISGKSDEELAADAAEGSSSGFETLVERYSGKLYLFINRSIRSSDESLDILQDVFFKVYKNISRFDSRWKFSTWIYTIASREMVSHFRKGSVREKNIPEAESKNFENPEDTFFRSEAGNIWKLAKKLKPAWYNILWLKYSEGKTNTEIAKITNRSAISVRVALHRSRTKLAELYRQEELQEFPTASHGGGNILVGE